MKALGVNRLAVVSLIVVLFFPKEHLNTSPVHGTSLAFGVSTDGIVLGEDHLRAANGDKFVVVIPKFSFCGTDIVCGSTGLAAHDFSCSFTDQKGVVRGGNLKYNSYGWLASIEKDSGVAGKTSPKIVADTIWKKASSTFDPIECFYFHTKEGQGQIESDGPVMFVVAGYPSDSETPEVYVVRVQYDRQNSKLVYPAPEKIALNGFEKSPGRFVAGEQERFRAIQEKREPFFSMFVGFYTKRLTRTSLLLKDAPTTLQETVAWVAASIDLESEFNEKVGGGSSLAVIRKGQPPTTLFMPTIASK